uniref:JmjC domain-containing protein n=1 Tax=Parastrongyloides trichosuri TaxID=131310 RepID=A0A0N4ZY62_PARTI
MTRKRKIDRGKANESPIPSAPSVCETDDTLKIAGFEYNFNKILNDTRYERSDLYKIVPAKDINLNYFRTYGAETPILVDGTAQDLGMVMPNEEEFDIDKIVNICGKEMLIDVIKVGKFETIKMSLEDFATYFKKKPEERKELLNSLSLEFSYNKLFDHIKSPTFIRDMDWVIKYWPDILKFNQLKYIEKEGIFTRKTPNVHNYSLASVKNCYTDFHMDFGGTSVWYHILKGKKVFWLIPPTKKNMGIHEDLMKGCKSVKQFLGELVDDCFRITLNAGQTFLIPAGWIHSVYTPIDSIVFGGNYIHSLSIPLQLEVHKSETRSRIGEVYKYPFFNQLLWYSVSGIVEEATSLIFLNNSLTNRKKCSFDEDFFENITIEEFAKQQNGLHETIKFFLKDQDSLTKIFNKEYFNHPEEFIKYDKVRTGRNDNVSYENDEDFKKLLKSDVIDNWCEKEIEGFAVLHNYLNTPSTKNAKLMEPIPAGITRPFSLLRAFKEIIKFAMKVKGMNINIEELGAADVTIRKEDELDDTQTTSLDDTLEVSNVNEEVNGKDEDYTMEEDEVDNESLICHEDIKEEENVGDSKKDENVEDCKKESIVEDCKKEPNVEEYGIEIKNDDKKEFCSSLENSESLTTDQINVSSIEEEINNESKEDKKSEELNSEASKQDDNVYKPEDNVLKLGGTSHSSLYKKKGTDQRRKVIPTASRTLTEKVECLGFTDPKTSLKIPRHPGDAHIKPPEKMLRLSDDVPKMGFEPCPILDHQGFLLKPKSQFKEILKIDYPKHCTKNTSEIVKKMNEFHKVAKLKGAYFIVDWHNYTWSILNQKFSTNNNMIEEKEIPIDSENDKSPFIGTTKMYNSKSIEKLINLTHWYEGFFGRRSHYSICVSKAMKKNLKDVWNVDSNVLYDRAPSWNFKRLMSNEKCEFLKKLSHQNGFESFLDQHGRSKFVEDKENGELRIRQDRPLLLISSTSWTEDEDFSILLDALVEYDQDLGNDLPNIICVITGKGPKKEYYLKKIKDLSLKKIYFITPWLEASDYPKLVGSSDLGVCLHTSTSGIDLPMKVVDMFGCKTPVLAKKFFAIEELIEDGFNGYLFNDSNDLKQRLISLSTGFPSSSIKLNELHFNLMNQNHLTWEDNWNQVFWPILEGISKRRFDKEIEEMGLDKENYNDDKKER